MSASVINFSAGPALLPAEVMRQAQAEFIDWQASGKSVMEISHRGPEFLAIAAHAEATLRELLAIPPDYHVLFLAGGATQQFSALPMNLPPGRAGADYLHTGHWSGRALRVAGAYGRVNIACSAEPSGFTALPARSAWRLNPDATYCFYCDNETISGLEFKSVPEVAGVLATDMTSSILSKVIDISRFGVIIAGAQKNIAPAGLTIVIVKAGLLTETWPGTPDLLNYRLQAEAGGMLNTPPTFNWYMAGLVFDWVKAQGGAPEMQRRAEQKAGRLYDLIDASALYQNPVAEACRSRMNVVFTLADKDLTPAFLRAAEQAGLHGLRGHRQVGGLRASIYNAMPESGVVRLADFMREFERVH